MLSDLVFLDIRLQNIQDTAIDIQLHIVKFLRHPQIDIVFLSHHFPLIEYCFPFILPIHLSSRCRFLIEHDSSYTFIILFLIDEPFIHFQQILCLILNILYHFFDHLISIIYFDILFLLFLIFVFLFLLLLLLLGPFFLAIGPSFQLTQLFHLLLLIFDQIIYILQLFLKERPHIISLHPFLIHCRILDHPFFTILLLLLHFHTLLTMTSKLIPLI